jgi:hypothetical protein
MRAWLLVPLFVIGCAASNGTGDGSPLPDGGAIADDGSTGGGDLASAPDGGGCASSADCPGGVCVAGACCSAGAVCGSACCGSGETCLFDACVVPGKECHGPGDCASGQYCETALGGSVDGGTAGDGGAFCTQALATGRCLALPTVCADGGTNGCVEACEYHPVATPTLQAVPRWTWGPTAKEFPDFTDVWSTPTVGRIYDSNCDGKIDETDPPNLVFVAGNVAPSNTPRANGVLRMLDGRSGAEIWSLQKASPSSSGFLGNSVAIGDVDGDGRIDIVAVTGEKYLVLIDANGKVLRTSDKPIPTSNDGWGGGVALGDMDGDGHPEIAFGATVFSTTNNAITLSWTGKGGAGGGGNEELTTFVDLDGDGTQELLAGRTAYRADGSMLWNRTDLPDGFPGVGDFNGDGKPEVVLVYSGQVWLLEGATGATQLGPLMLAGSGTGGPPTVADFDGDGKPEIGVAKATYYSVAKPNYAAGTLEMSTLWSVPNHDLSSSVTGSSVFDFEGDGKAEVIYGDECFLWVFDGQTGKVRFAAPHTSFTATEASVVADVDGDGRAELIMVSNGASPTSWGCQTAAGVPTTVNGQTWTKGPGVGGSYRGITVFGDAASSWVGTRTLWNQHTYHVSNICDDRDSACAAPNVYGSIPAHEKPNWQLPWLNNFRQNVQDHGLFNAPNATASLSVVCSNPVLLHPTVRNLGLASLPAGVVVGVYDLSGGGQTLVGQAVTTKVLLPGQGEQLTITATAGSSSDTFMASLIIDPANPTFHECRSDDNSSPPVTATCIQ